jgi:hypothetical protein
MAGRFWQYLQIPSKIAILYGLDEGIRAKIKDKIILKTPTFTTLLEKNQEPRCKNQEKKLFENTHKYHPVFEPEAQS